MKAAIFPSSDKAIKKKDGPNHPFLPNLTYFYEKKPNCMLFPCV